MAGCQTISEFVGIQRQGQVHSCRPTLRTHVEQVGFGLLFEAGGTGQVRAGNDYKLTFFCHIFRLGSRYSHDSRRCFPSSAAVMKI